MAQTIDAATLKRRLDAGEPLTLVNILPEEAFAVNRLPRSLNACVYEVTFPEKIRCLVADREKPIVVYGIGEPFHASERAAERLEGMGYRRVYDFRGGIEAWRTAGLPLEGEGVFARPAVRDGTFAIDPRQSLLEWKGSNVANRHRGTIGVKSGTATIADGKLTAAECIAKMDALACDDIDDPQMNATLITHLKSDDFFDVARYPEAKFKLTEFQHRKDAPPGDRSATVRGELMIRGITQAIEFPATVDVSLAALALHASFEIDRTRWNVRYGSGKFFECLGKHLVNDAVSLSLKMVAPLK